MTELEYDQYTAGQRCLARNHLDDLIRGWREDLWPNPVDDPIAHEDRRRRERALLANHSSWGLGLRPVYERSRDA